MQRCLDYLMRRKGWFLALLTVFALGGFLGYQAVTTWKQYQIEVPHTGGDNQKYPNDCIMSDYSSGKTTVSDTLAQMGTFPFDFDRDLKPGMSAVSAVATDTPTGTREVVRTVAKVVFGSSVLALVLHFLSDHYLR